MPIVSGSAAAAAAAGAMRQLFDSTLGADTASIDTGANGVAQTCNHLLIVMLLRTTQAAAQSSASLLLNNDSAAHYDRVNVSANSSGSSGSAGAGESAGVIVCPGASVAVSTLFGAAQVLIPAYLQTTADGIVLPIAGFADSTTTDSLVQSRPTHWTSTVAITRVSVTAVSGVLKAGSRMTIYGLT